MERFITGNKFKALADYTFAPPAKRGDDYYNLPSTYDPDKIKDGDIVYTDNGYAQELVNEIKKLDKKVILITHNGDTGIDIIPPDNVIKWYAQNVNIIHERVESIPIGMENDKWFPEVQKKQKMLNRLMIPKDYRGLMYMSHSIATNPIVRGSLYDMFEDKPWVTTVRGSNRACWFDQYLDNIDSHKFVISPEGNGLDTHRTWECLYIESIPIEKRNLNNRFYTDLPICFVDDWEEITEDFLNAEYERIVNQKWNIQKIDFQYWENILK